MICWEEMLYLVKYICISRNLNEDHSYFNMALL